MKRFFKKFKKNKKGAVALISVVLVSAAAIIISRGLSFLTLSEVDAGVSLDNGKTADYFANGCVEETIRRIIIDNDYAASNFTLENRNDYCIINVSASGNERTILAQGIHNEYSKTIEAVIDITGEEINIISWQGVEN